MDSPKDGTWISVVAPDEEEIKYITERFKLDTGFVRSSLDEEESSRIESEEDQTLIIVDYAVADTNTMGRAVFFYTMPMGIIITKKNVITISLKDNNIIDEMSSGMMKNINTTYKTRFVLQLLLRIATRFLAYLKQIDKLTSFTEKQLHVSMKNAELIQLLDLGKSLVYFSTSLKANQATLDRMFRSGNIHLYEEDRDLLEDVLIEVKQAIEMAQIYSQIINGMTESISAIINNNMNTVIRKLTVITILLAIPTIIFSFYGMNVQNLPLIDNPLWSILFAFLGTSIAAFILKLK
ncbi:MAG: magnesium transporter CorA family protein [Oscillospiraceae bacterium]|nr:magnesium transporter CorA family protein [Oscillospiraceae bacterium]